MTTQECNQLYRDLHAFDGDEAILQQAQVYSNGLTLALRHFEKHPGLHTYTRLLEELVDMQLMIARVISLFDDPALNDVMNTLHEAKISRLQTRLNKLIAANG